MKHIKATRINLYNDPNLTCTVDNTWVIYWSCNMPIAALDKRDDKFYHADCDQFVDSPRVMRRYYLVMADNTNASAIRYISMPDLLKLANEQALDDC